MTRLLMQRARSAPFTPKPRDQYQPDQGKCVETDWARENNATRAEAPQADKLVPQGVREGGARNHNERQVEGGRLGLLEKGQVAVNQGKRQRRRDGCTEQADAKRHGHAL